MRRACLAGFASTLIALTIAGCGNEGIKPEESIADQLKAAKIDPKGQSKSEGAKKVGETPPATQ